MNQKSRKKLRLQDITYYSKQKMYPFAHSFSRTPTNKSKNSTKYISNNSGQLFHYVTSPECGNKNRGIMRQAIAQRIQFYKNDYKRKFLRRTIQDIKEQAKGKQLRQLRESPIINEQSKKLYQKVKQKRNLSPKVLVRFEQYERSKTLKKLKLKIQAYYKQTQRIPRPQQIISPQKLGQMQQAKKLIDTLQESIKKFVVKPPIENQENILIHDK